MEVKTARLFLLILMVAACRQMEQPSFDEVFPSSGQVYSLTVLASKGNPEAKALELVGGGSRLKVYWKDSEKVKVFKDGALVGVLDVVPDPGEMPSSATLRGDIAVNGLDVGDELTMIIPRESWDYTGQNGTLTGEGSIEDTYAYATATVAVTAISDGGVSTADAHFANSQSIYRFAFTLEGSPLPIKDFILSDANGSLVRSREFIGGAWVSSFGYLGVTPVSATSEPLYVSLCNDVAAADTYNFILTGASDELVLASQAIPASVLSVPSKLINAAGIPASQPDFSPEAGETTTAL